MAQPKKYETLEQLRRAAYEFSGVPPEIAAAMAAERENENATQTD